jgi:hypothetical protein
MHSDTLANLLDKLVLFANRVIPKIKQHPHAEALWLSRDMLIQRRHWRELCQGVLRLVHSLGLHEACFARDSPRDIDSWPSYDCLLASARRAMRFFGKF